MNELALAWRLARRELRSGLQGFAVFLACLALGVAAIAAVGVTNAGVIDAIKRDAAALLGGDVRLEATNLPIAEDVLAGLMPPEARRSEAVRTNAMAFGPEGRRVVVSLKAVDGAYPLYGAVGLEPSLDLARALADGGAVVDPGVLTRLGVGIGEQIRIGEATFTVRATIVREPDQLVGFETIGPRVMIAMADLARTQVILPGALARYDYRFALPAGSDAAALVAELRRSYPDAHWRARSTRDVQPQVTRFTDRLASYLTMAALTTLLIGGIGVALAIQNFLAGKTSTIATLKCLGARSRLIFRMYLLQVLVLAGIGIAAGLAIGNLAPWLLAAVAARLSPIRMTIGFYPLPLLIAAACGLLSALVFAIWPLARAGQVSPAGMFRALLVPPRRLPPAAALIGLGLSLVALAALAVAGVADRRLGAIFVAVAVVAAGLLVGIAWLVLRAVRLVGKRGSARMRIALANLQRPGAGARGVIVALGAGLTVLTMVALLERNLAAEIELHLPERAPGVFFIDIQPDQVDRFEQAVAAIDGAHILQIRPVIRGRVVRIKGVPVDQTGIEHWTLRRDRGLSYAAEAAAADRAGGGLVVARGLRRAAARLDRGRSRHGLPRRHRRPPELQRARPGDRGRDREPAARDRLEPGAPRFRVPVQSRRARSGATHLCGHGRGAARARGSLLDQVAATLPNVTPITIREVVERVGGLLGNLRIAVAVVGGVTLLSGVLVLAGAAAAARRRHLYEAVVLKVLGARRSDLLRIFLLEYLGLGATAAVAGGLLGTLGAAVIVIGVMHLEWTFAPVVVVLVLLLALAITLAAGFVGTWRLLGRSAAAVLRAP